MSDIKFNCPHCHMKLGVPEAVFGQTIACPLCGGHIGLPPARTKKPPAPETAPASGSALRVIGIGLQQQQNDIKFSCPNCDVHIVISNRASGKQISCQRCGSRIQVPAQSPAPAEAPTTEPAAQPVAAQVADAQPASSLPPTSAAPTPATPPLAGAKPIVPSLVNPAAQAAPAPAAKPIIPALAKPEQAAPAKPDASQIPALIERLRNGDVQVGRDLIRFGESVIPALIEAFNEQSLEAPDTNRGTEHIINLLAKCGGICVPHLTAKLGKSRYAYYALAKIGNDEAIKALLRELSSVNWHRVEIACKALGTIETPSVQNVVTQIEMVRKSTRVGEVFIAAGNAITAIQARFPKVQVTGTSLPKPQVVRGQGGGAPSAFAPMPSHA